MLEQAAENAASDHELGLIDTSIISQAISLKRIADALEKLTIVPTMTELSPELQKEFEEMLKTPSDIIFNKS